MSSYSETDFCEAGDGLDYIFAVMGAIYGATFTRHFERVDVDVIRQVWTEKLGVFLTYKPTLDYALDNMPAKMPPTALEFRNICRDGPRIPQKPTVLIERQPTEYEKAMTEIKKSEALAKLKELKAQFSAKAKAYDDL